jgi:hypothetical protein
LSGLRAVAQMPVHAFEQTWWCGPEDTRTGAKAVPRWRQVPKPRAGKGQHHHGMLARSKAAASHNRLRPPLATPSRKSELARVPSARRRVKPL